MKPFLISGILIEGGILLLAAFLRFWMLDLKPAHFDEGINGWFVDQMKIHGSYHYDPENYHGPLYFYLLFISLSLLGRNLWALRLPAVMASLTSVWMMMRFDRYVGTLASRFAALALALSSAMVFYGRYGIHESTLLLSLLITIWGIFGLWKYGNRDALIATVIGVTLMLLTKETAVIHLVCFLLAVGVLTLWQKVVPSAPAQPLAARSWSEVDLSWCCAAAFLALIFFYSGTFLNWSGVPAFFEAYAKWFHTGTGDGGHIKADYQIGPLNYYWLALMARYEWPSLLGLLYAVRLAWPLNFAGSPLMRYLAIYGWGVLIVYSIVPYKTPWCLISILWPFTILFGCAVQEAWEKIHRKIVVTLVTVGFLAVSLYSTARLNFYHFADPKEPFVYVQTMPEVARLTKPVLALARKDPRFYSTSAQIVLESYYPLPWIFGDFTQIGYFDKMPTTLDGGFVVALASQQKEVEKLLKEPYFRYRFRLRDSMDDCMVWFKESLFYDWFANPLHGTPELVMPKK